MNYTFTSEIITAATNQTWDSVDVDGDGTSDSGLLPIKITLEATNPSAYTISAWDFTIDGAGNQFGTNGSSSEEFNPVAWYGDMFQNIDGWNEELGEVTNIPTGRVWNAYCFCFDDKISYIVGLNTQEPHTVGNKAIFLVYLKNEINIQASNIDIPIDFDGDAQAIPPQGNPDPTPNPDLVEFRSWTLEVEMRNDNIEGWNDGSWNSSGSNCLVVSHTDDIPNNFINQWNGSGDTEGSTSGGSPIATGRARVRFSPYVLYDGSYGTYEDSAALDGSGTTYIAPLFYILPKPGYAISRSMLNISVNHSTNSSGQTLQIWIC